MKKIITLLTAFVMTFTLFSNTLSVLPASAEETKPTIENEISVNGENSFGNLISKEFSAKIDEQQANNGCNIFSAEVTEDEALISFETAQDCTLVVAIYDEEGVQMLASGSAEVTKGETEKKVIIKTESMPEYFYLKAYLVDTYTLKPICTVYDCPNYTKEMQEFFAKTVDDFDSEYVLNLDEDKTNNFAVFGDGVKMIVSDGDSNKVTTADEDNNKYVIENADDSVTSLVSGDTFAYKYDNGEVLIVKVADIKLDGTTATITGKDTSMEDVFEYVKIDASAGTENAVVDDSKLPEGVTYNGNEEVADESQKKSMYSLASGFSIYAEEGEKRGDETLSYTLTEASVGDEDSGFSAKISGSVNGNLVSYLKYYASWSYQYIEAKFDYSVQLTVEVSGKCVGAVEFGYLFIPIVPGVYFDVTLSLVLEAEAKIELIGTLSGTLGFVYDSDTGKRSLNTTPDLETEFKVEGVIFAGISIKPSITIIDKHVVDISVDLRAGAEIKAELSTWKESTAQLTEEDLRHECKKCLDGDISVKFSITGEVKFWNNEKFTYNINFAEVSCHLYDFYYSFDYDDFAFTSCPHNNYRVTLTVKDRNLKSLGNVDVSKVMRGFTYWCGKTDSSGKVEFFLPSGTYYFTSKNGGMSGTTTVNVEDEDTSYSLILNHADPVIQNPVDINVSVLDKEGNPIEGAEISSDYNDKTYETNSDGFAIMTLPAGEKVKIYAAAENYLRKTEYITVDEKEMNVELSLSKKGSSSSSGSSGMAIGNTGIVGKIKEVSLGCFHSAALTEDGSLYTWGDNYYGQLGNGKSYSKKNSYDDVIDSSTPIKIMDNVKSVSVCYHNGAAITEDGSLYMWGYNGTGQLGNGTKEDSSTPIKIMDNVKSVSLGNMHSGAVTEDGSLYMWGYNSSGQLGSGMREYKSTLNPIKIMDNVKSVNLCYNQSAAITDDGSLYMWGYNDRGQLGNGTTRYSSPIKIMDNVKSVSLGNTNSGAVTEDGILYIWGDNRWGQFGNGTKEDSSTPIKIMDNVKSVSLGNTHSGAITEDGSLYMWGSNGYGELGNGTTEDSLTPIKINTTSGTVSLPSNLVSSLSLLADEPTEETAKTESFTGLIPNSVYNFYVMKSSDIVDSLSSKNLLYISQGISDAKGNLTVTYLPKEEYANAEIFVKAMASTDISGAKVTVNDLSCNGEEQFAQPVVTLGGVTLTEGTDYNIEKDYSAADPGEYELIIVGTGDYTGKISASYNVNCEHNFVDGKCIICGLAETVEIIIGDANGDGKFNIRDAAFIARAMANGEKIDAAENAAADYNEDGSVNIRDAAAIAKYFAGAENK